MNPDQLLNCKSTARAALLISALAIFGIQVVQAQSDGAPQPEVQQLQKQLEQMQRQIERLKTQISRLQDAHNRAPLGGGDEASEVSLISPNLGDNDIAASATTIPTTHNANAASSAAAAQTSSDTKSANTQTERSLNIYGFAQLDSGYNFKTIDPNWFDVLRPSKLPATPGQFGEDGSTFFSVRQTRFGVKGVEPTPWGDLKATFEFDMFGVGAQAGQTQIRPRHYFGQLGAFLAGQTNTVFMDPDVFPNVLDYWGPNGMVFIRQPQFRWMPIQRENTHLWISAEAPGQSGDQGLLADRIQEAGIKARFQYPDIAAQFRYGGSGGYIQGAAVVRNVKLDQTGTSPFNLNQSLTGWGFNISSLAKMHKDSLHLQYVVGNGIENYMNDAPFDVAPIANPGNLTRPVKGKPIPMWSFVTYLDHKWSDKVATSLGFSELQMQNTSLQAANAFHLGQYSTVNLVYSPTEHLMYGGEFQWARRSNTAAPGANDYKLQFSFKYSFDAKIIGPK